MFSINIYQTRRDQCLKVMITYTHHGLVNPKYFVVINCNV